MKLDILSFVILVRFYYAYLTNRKATTISEVTVRKRRSISCHSCGQVIGTNDAQYWITEQNMPLGRAVYGAGNGTRPWQSLPTLPDSAQSPCFTAETQPVLWASKTAVTAGHGGHGTTHVTRRMGEERGRRGDCPVGLAGHIWAS